jgi:hypothetical protein
VRCSLLLESHLPSWSRLTDMISLCFIGREINVSGFLYSERYAGIVYACTDRPFIIPYEVPLERLLSVQNFFVSTGTVPENRLY